MTAAISEGYTLVTCVAPACGTEQPDRLAVVLRDCVLSSRDGVLVVSGCSLGAVSCRFRPAGPLVHVQPCDADRRPTGPVVRVGPIRSEQDIAAVQAWIRTARLDPALLPSHLVELHWATRAARGSGAGVGPGCVHRDRGADGPRAGREDQRL